MDVSEPVLLILLSLAEQPRHGYAILQDTEQMSEGRVRLSTGTLYGALRRLIEEMLRGLHDADLRILKEAERPSQNARPSRMRKKSLYWARFGV